MKIIKKNGDALYKKILENKEATSIEHEKIKVRLKKLEEKEPK